jgi:hypothetical protein
MLLIYQEQSLLQLEAILENYTHIKYYISNITVKSAYITNPNILNISPFVLAAMLKYYTHLTYTTWYVTI